VLADPVDLSDRTLHHQNGTARMTAASIGCAGADGPLPDECAAAAEARGEPALPRSGDEAFATLGRD
jgi:hypothetical protein